MIQVSDQSVQNEMMKQGKVTGISVATAGVVTSVVTFTNAFSNALDNVQLTLADPSASGAVFGGVWVTGDTKSGFTINIDVTTAAAAGTTISCYWLAFGN